jgi:hypothetical protein
LYNILSKLGIPRKLVGINEMCLNEIYRTDRIGKKPSDKFPVENVLKQEEN